MLSFYAGVNTALHQAGSAALTALLRYQLEAWKRGWSRAAKKVVMGDGAEWIWNLAGLHFPGAVQIVDLYHARQYL